MNQIIIAVLFSVERENEAVCTAAVAVFRAIICAPFVTNNERNLLFQPGKCLFDFSDILFRCGAFEFKGDNMSKFSLLRAGTRISGHDRKRSDQGTSQEKTKQFHILCWRC